MVCHWKQRRLKSAAEVDEEGRHVDNQRVSVPSQLSVRPRGEKAEV